MRARVAVAVLPALIALAAPAPALAGDPIMPLSDVHRGMQCTGRSVIHGTDISTFDVEVRDVVDAQPDEDGPRILVRVSGPAIDATGIGPGFSGSPIYCKDSAGVERNAGAISESIGEYGNKLALATPIEQILGETADPPPGARTGASARRVARSARDLASPLTVAGLSRPLGQALTAAAKKVGRTVIAVPSGPLGSFAPQPLIPGASVSTGLSSGAVAIGAIGTVAYEDGGRVWAFGHPLDGVGPRSLLLQDAYVYDVVNNPGGVGDAVTYKLAAPGHDLGTLTNDALDAVVGKVGALPPRIPMRIVARDLDTGRQRVTSVAVADETDAGLPTGSSPLSLVGGTALAQAASSILRGEPARQTGTMCLRIALRERPKPLRFCNRYVGDATAGSDDSGSGVTSVVEVRLLSDFAAAVDALDTFRFGTVHVTGVEADVKLQRGLRQAFMTSARVPRRVRAGQRIPVRLRLRRVLGGRATVTLRVRVPSDLPAGRRSMILTGAPSDSPDGDFTTLLGSLVTQEIVIGEDTPGGDTGPRTLPALAARIASIGQYDGLSALFSRLPDATGGGDVGDPVYRSKGFRISGRLPVRLHVVRRGHGRTTGR